MESDTWTILSAATKRHQSAAAALHSRFDAYLGFEEVDSGDDDDVARVEFGCPFSSEDLDIFGLFCHSDDEHPNEARNGMDVLSIAIRIPNWSELTADILENIFSLLESIADCINFRAVCSSWRSVTMRMSAHKSHLPKQAPWLMIPYDRYDQEGTHTILSLADGKAHTVYLPETRNRKIKGSSHGWLVLADEEISQNNLILLQPITRRIIELPSLTTLDAETKLAMVRNKEDYLDSVYFLVRELKYATISSNPGVSDNDWVVTISVWRDLAVPFIYYRKGNNKWTAAAPLAHLPQCYYDLDSFSHYYNTENFICGKDYDDTFWAWRAEHPDATPFPLKMLPQSTSSLSRHNGKQQLYYVTRELDDCITQSSPSSSLEEYPTGYFEVQELFITNKEKEMDDTAEWNDMADWEACLSPCNDIGKNVLLVPGRLAGTMGILASSNFPGGRCNCAYFVHVFEHRTYGLGLHDLKKKTTEWLLPRWKILSYNSVPLWFLPSF